MPKKPEPSENEATETVTVSKSDLATLLARLDKLETQAQQEVEISADLPQVAALKPGQYVNIAAPNQAPDLRKVRWTKGAIEKTYPSVTFLPLINIRVAPHGIVWDLVVGESVTVPSIVRDFHDTEYQRQRHFFDRYAPEGAMEIMEGIQRSKANQGVPVWGRVHIVGNGLVMSEQAEATETKA